MVSSCDHPAEQGGQPLWRLNGYPITMRLEPWMTSCIRKDPNWLSIPTLGQASGVCLTASKTVQAQIGFPTSTRLILQTIFLQLTSYQASYKTKWEQAEVWLVHQLHFSSISSFKPPHRNKSWMYLKVKRCDPPITSKDDRPVTHHRHAKPGGHGGNEPAWIAHLEQEQTLPQQGQGKKPCWSSILCGGKPGGVGARRKGEEAVWP